MNRVHHFANSRFCQQLGGVASCVLRSISHGLIVYFGAHGAPYGLSAALASNETEQTEAVITSLEADTTWKYKVRLSKFERQFSTDNDDELGEWAGFFVLAKDPSAIWLTTKGSIERGDTDSAEVRLFYSYTIAPHIGLQAGWRRDIEPEPKRDWLGFGLIGVLPFTIGADASIFIGESDRLAARLEIAYRHKLTDRLSLTPDIEANFYSQSDPETGVGSGLSDLDLGLRLRYRIVTGIAPYAGITWKGNFADTADSVEGEGEDSGDLRLLLGVTLWF